MDSGKIYCITSPSGKKYIGQVVDYIKNGSKKGVNGRWKQHCRSASSKNLKSGCSLLNTAINKYGKDNFVISVLKSCPITELDKWEEHFIKEHNTMVPNGYNLIEGGKSNSRHSEQTCKKRSESLKQLLKDPEKRKIWSDAKKGIPQNKKKKRKYEEDDILPKYIRRIRGKYSGYCVDSHPKCKNKKFTSKKFSMEENLKKAIEFLKTLNRTTAVQRLDVGG